MKSFKQLQSFLNEEDKNKSSGVDTTKKDEGNKSKKKKDKSSSSSSTQRSGVIGSFITGFAAAAHRDIMGTAQKYGYHPIAHYVGYRKNRDNERH